MPTVQIEGYVESVDPNIFSKDPELQVSIICPSPFFEVVNAISVAGVTVALGSNTMTEIDYAGDIAVGYVLDVVQGTAAAMSSGELRIINNTPTTQIFDATGVEVDGTDYFEQSTMQGAKYAHAVPITGGLAVNLLGKVAPGSIWSLIVPGTNNFQVMSSKVGQTWTLTYKALYGGM